jgi:SAM-dependent methyltransferase
MTTSSPSALRNRDPILSVLRTALPSRGLVLEIASGTGEHVTHFARTFPAVTFQPTDLDAAARAGIDARTAADGAVNVRTALALDAAGDDWPVRHADAILCVNMIHISPWAATEGLARGAGRVIAPGGVLFLYGPYRRAGAHNTPSNEAFDRSLRERNPSWGVRDLEAVSALVRAQGFSSPEIHEMPANNLSLVFRRATS